MLEPFSATKLLFQWRKKTYLELRPLFRSQIFSVFKCCDIQGSHLIGYLWVSLFIGQSECLVFYFFCTELTLFFCIEREMINHKGHEIREIRSVRRICIPILEWPYKWVNYENHLIQLNLALFISFQKIYCFHNSLKTITSIMFLKNRINELIFIF